MFDHWYRFPPGGGSISGDDCQLDIFDVNCVRLRQRCCRGLHHCGEGRYVQHLARLGSEQCGRDASRSEFWGQGCLPGAEITAWRIAKYYASYMAVAAIAMLVFDEEIARLFTRESEVLFHAVNCPQILACGYVGSSFGMAVIQALNGAGDTIPY